MTAPGLFARRRFAAGEHIVVAGDPAETCFVVERGQVEILSRDDAGLYAVVDVLGPGRVFGERGLAGDGVHETGARAVEATDCVAVSRAALAARLETADPFVAALVKVLAGNLTSILDRRTAAAHDADRAAGDGAVGDLARFAE